MISLGLVISLCLDINLFGCCHSSCGPTPTNEAA
jgi:hypothetical protein